MEGAEHPALLPALYSNTMLQVAAPCMHTACLPGCLGIAAPLLRCQSQCPLKLPLVPPLTLGHGQQAPVVVVLPVIIMVMRVPAAVAVTLPAIVVVIIIIVVVAPVIIVLVIVLHNQLAVLIKQTAEGLVCRWGAGKGGKGSHQ